MAASLKVLDLKMTLKPSFIKLWKRSDIFFFTLDHMLIPSNREQIERKFIQFGRFDLKTYRDEKAGY
jgi:hypothetical protein